MRWSMWPVSICAHLIAAIGVFIAPLMADVEPPEPAPMRRLAIATKAVPVPPSIVQSVPLARRSTPVLPNVIAPLTLTAPPETDPQPSAVDVPGLTVDHGGVIDPGLIGTPGPVAVVPPPPPPQPKPQTPAVFRVGQGVREPKRVAGAPPEYPEIARRAKVDGSVILEAVINERGGVERIRVLKSVPLLDGAAVTAVSGWRYTPTLLNGVPVSVLMTITINFTLQN